MIKKFMVFMNLQIMISILNMWSSTKADDLRSSLKRLNKIELSKSSNDILEIILFSFSYPPQGMTEKEFNNLKIDWLIKNNRLI